MACQLDQDLTNKPENLISAELEQTDGEARLRLELSSGIHPPLPITPGKPLAVAFLKPGPRSTSYRFHYAGADWAPGDGCELESIFLQPHHSGLALRYDGKLIGCNTVPDAELAGFYIDLKDFPVVFYAEDGQVVIRFRKDAPSQFFHTPI